MTETTTCSPHANHDQDINFRANRWRLEWLIFPKGKILQKSNDRVNLLVDKSLPMGSPPINWEYLDWDETTQFKTFKISALFREELKKCLRKRFRIEGNTKNTFFRFKDNAFSFEPFVIKYPDDSIALYFRMHPESFPLLTIDLVNLSSEPSLDNSLLRMVAEKMYAVLLEGDLNARPKEKLDYRFYPYIHIFDYSSKSSSSSSPEAIPWHELVQIGTRHTDITPNDKKLVEAYKSKNHSLRSGVLVVDKQSTLVVSPEEYLELQGIRYCLAVVLQMRALIELQFRENRDSTPVDVELFKRLRFTHEHPSVITDSYNYQILWPLITRECQVIQWLTNIENKPGGKRNIPVSVSTSQQILPDLQPPINILVIATEWFSVHGGLSTLNRNLCNALAKLGCRVICVVSSASSVEIGDALKSGVQLLASATISEPGTTQLLFGRIELPDGFVPNIVIGHGRITGRAAEEQVDKYFPKSMRIHFVHMAPGEIEWYKGNDDAAERADSREKIEIDLAKGAGMVVAIGPRLYTEVGNWLSAFDSPPHLHQLDPGFAPTKKRTPPIGLHCLVLGRAEDLELKGLDIAALALNRVALSGTTFEHELELVVRGAPKGTGTGLRTHLQALASKSDLAIRVREYSESQDDIDKDLRRSTLLLMPSRREGFGLVALESLTAGTPLLVSSKSGIGQLIKGKIPLIESQHFVVETKDNAEESAGNWAKAIEYVLRDREAAFDRTRKLSEDLSKIMSWDLAVTSLLEAIRDNKKEGRNLPGAVF